MSQTSFSRLYHAAACMPALHLCSKAEHLCRTNRRRQYVVDEWIDAFDLPLSDHLKRSQPIGLFQGQWSWRDVGERIAYRYFCWRCLPLLCWSLSDCNANPGRTAV